MSCPRPPPHIDTQEYTRTCAHTCTHTRACTHMPLPWALSLQDRVCNVTPLYRQETEAQGAGEPSSEGWRWGGVCSHPGSRGQLTGEEPGHPGPRTEWGSESSAPSPSRIGSEGLQVGPRPLLPAPQLPLWPRQNRSVSGRLKPSPEEAGHCSGDTGAPPHPAHSPCSAESLLQSQWVLQPRACLSSCLGGVGISEELAPPEWAGTDRPPPAHHWEPALHGRGWRVGGGIRKSYTVCFRNKPSWDWRGTHVWLLGGQVPLHLCPHPRRSCGPTLRSQRCGYPLALLQGHLQVDCGVWRLGPSSGEAGPGWGCGRRLATANCLVDGPSHMWGGGECRFSGGVPLPIFALRGTGRAREYSAEATDLTQLFATHTESAAKTSSAGPAQPSPADSGRTEPPPNPPLSSGASRVQPPCPPAQPVSNLSGASTRHPLDLPTSSLCLTRPAPLPADSPPSPS